MRDNISLQKEIADLKIQLVLIRSDEAKSKAVTDFEAFAEFFKSKGVVFVESDDFDEPEKYPNVIRVGDQLFRFDHDDVFMGTYNYESGYFHERIPAPESKP